MYGRNDLTDDSGDPFPQPQPGGTFCQFPFKWKGDYYHNCKLGDGPGVGKDNKPDDKYWCSTEVDGNRNHVDGKYAYCADDCSEYIVPGNYSSSRSDRTTVSV